MRTFLLSVALVVALAFPAVGVAATTQPPPNVIGCGDSGCGSSEPPYACDAYTLGWTFTDQYGITFRCTFDWNGSYVWAY